MSLAERAKAKQSRQGPECGVRVLLESVDDAYRAELLDMLDRHGIQGTAIAAVLREDGHRISSDTVQRHRRGECRCEA